jgi:hypothetical protein
LKNYEGDEKADDKTAYAQAELVALADGCAHLFESGAPGEHPAVEYMRKSMFCCPK